MALYHRNDRWYTDCTGCAQQVELDPEASRAVCGSCQTVNIYNPQSLREENVARGKNWSAEEQAIIGEFYPAGGAKLVFQKLGGSRTHLSIRAQAKKSNLKSGANPANKSIEKHAPPDTKQLTIGKFQETSPPPPTIKAAARMMLDIEELGIETVRQIVIPLAEAMSAERRRRGIL